MITIARPWIAKPNLHQVEMNFAHPLALGLTGYWLMNTVSAHSITASTIRDLSLRRGALTIYLAPEWTAGSAPMGTVLRLNSSSWILPFAFSTYITSTAGTVVTRALATANGSGADYTSPAVIVEAAQYASLIWANDGTNKWGAQNYPDVALGPTANLNQWYSVAWKHGGGNLSLHQDGVKYGTVASGATGSLTTAYVGSITVSSNIFPGQVDYLAVYDRALSDDFIAWWAKEPYALLKKRVVRTYVDVPAAAVGGAFKAAWARGSNVVLQSGRPG